MTSAKKVLDLDAVIEFDESPVHTVPFKLFGREWTLVCDVNQFALNSVGQPGGLARLLDSLILEEEQLDFRLAMTSQRGMTDEVLLAIFKQMLEAAGERPTTPPSSLSPTRRPPTSPRKSVAATSRTRGAR